MEGGGSCGRGMVLEGGGVVGQRGGREVETGRAGVG